MQYLTTDPQLFDTTGGPFPQHLITEKDVQAPAWVATVYLTDRLYLEGELVWYDNRLFRRNGKAQVADEATFDVTLWTAIDQKVPLGAMLYWSTLLTIPAGYHECNGSAIPAAPTPPTPDPYADFRALVGTTFYLGTGTAVPTFPLVTNMIIKTVV
jgi:hypothetical protein